MNSSEAVGSFEFSKRARARLIGARVDLNADWQAADSSQEADGSVDRLDGDVEPSFRYLLNLIVAADAPQPLSALFYAPFLRFAIDGNQTELWTVAK